METQFPPEVEEFLKGAVLGFEQVLQQHRAENFLVCGVELDVKDDSSQVRYTVTIQRAGRQTPAEKFMRQQELLGNLRSNIADEIRLGYGENPKLVGVLERLDLIIAGKSL